MNKLFVTFMVIMGIVVLHSFSNSNAYYKTGDVISLHRHTVGNGIAVVIIGDGFDREDCRKDGVYEYNCQKLTELFLSMPVIRDFKDYFDVFARVDVSQERGARNCVDTPDNCPDNAYGSGHPDLNWDKIEENATLATGGKTDRSIIFMANGMIGGHVINNIAIYSANEPNKAYWMMHEFAGHVLGHFPDLYYITGEAPVQESTKAAFDHGHGIGEFLMFEWRDDPKEVYWKDFIGQSGYEMVGVYPAAYWDLKFGSMFSCENIFTSVMYGLESPRYTVMERYQLWRFIQQRAGFTTVTIDEFKKYDVVNLKETDWSWNRYKEWTDDRIWNGK
ncbi:MAG: hypothetical protein LBS55_10620 [Prevotellaceae bacterium]|nr:hypothetical protein [Prevotellaceae bacterium]